MILNSNEVKIVSETLKIINENREKRNLKPITIEDVASTDIDSYRHSKSPISDVFQVDGKNTKSMITEIYDSIFSESDKSVSEESLMENLIFAISPYSSDKMK